jgi:hypothetical protein
MYLAKEFLSGCIAWVSERSPVLRVGSYQVVLVDRAKSGYNTVVHF